MPSRISTIAGLPGIFSKWLLAWVMPSQPHTGAAAEQPASRAGAAREAAAWRKLREMHTDLLEVSVTLQVRAPLSVFLTTLHRELHYAYRFQRPTPAGEWQLVQTWNPLGC